MTFATSLAGLRGGNEPPLRCAIVVATLDTRITFANDSFLAMWGFERIDQVLGRSYLDLYDTGITPEDLREILVRESCWDARMVAIRRNGSSFPIHASALAIRDSQGVVTHLIGAAIDIEQARQAEAALDARERLHALIFDTTPDAQGLLRVEGNGSFVFEAVNASYRNAVQAQIPQFKGPLIGREWAEVAIEQGFTPVEIERIGAENLRVASSKKPSSFEFEVPGCSPPVHIAVFLSPILNDHGVCTHLFWNARDVSSLKLATQSLRESEQRLQMIFNASADPQALFCMKDDNRLVLDAANHSFKERFRRKSLDDNSELRGQSHEVIMQLVGASFHYADLERTACLNAIENKQTTILELPLLDAQGPVYLDVRIEPVVRQEMSCTHLLWTGRDVTFRKKAEEQSRLSEAMYRQLFEQMPDGVFILSGIDGQWTKFSESWAKLLGYSKEELATLSLKTICSPEDFSTFSRFLESCSSYNKGHIVNLWVANRSGQQKRLELNVAPIESIGDVRFQCIARDITEYTSSQSQIATLRDTLAHVGRVRTMSEMASGLAHELNQPLGAIQLYSSTAAHLAEGCKNSELIEIVNKIQHQCSRAGDIIRRMRTFVSHNRSARELCDLNVLVGEVLALLEWDLHKHKVKLSLRLGSDLPEMWADRIQIQQVLVNLVRNSIEAMSRSDRTRELTVSTSRLTTALEVAVRDTGIGFAGDVKDALFKPFRSTKADGLGLGLAICKTLVEAHDGSISANHNEDGGATFRFTIPINRSGAS
jgi:two-component system, LuxR family, sensor kinase FixL